MPAHPNSGFKRAVFLVSILLMSSIAFAPMTSLASNSKSTTVWNGTINLVDGYTVESGEILVVEAGTVLTAKNFGGPRVGTFNFCEIVRFWRETDF